MHLLYLDESGNENDPTDRYFVLGGLSLFERQTFFLTQAIDAVQQRHFPNSPPIAFHASEIRAGRGIWRKVDRARRNQVCQRFDILLKRQYHDLEDPQRGLIVFSEGRFDARAKLWVKGFHQRGTRWGAINNLADIPYFAAMKESRLLQLADLVAHAVWLLYEKQDASLARPLLPHFAERSGTLHGLVHLGPSRGKGCSCPAYASRSTPGQLGPWV